MAGKVLNSSSLISFLRDANGAAALETLLVTANKKDSPMMMSDVALADVCSVITSSDGEAAWAAASGCLDGLPIEFLPTTRHLAESAADLKIRFRLTLADAFSAALAKEKKAELVSVDSSMKALENEVRLCLVHGL